MDERAEIVSLPEAEHGPAVASARWTAPPDVDLDHEIVARETLRLLLQAEVKVGAP